MKNINRLVFLIVVSLLVSGCNDFLAEVPDDRTLIDTPDKISALLVGAYPSAGYVRMAEVMSDNTGDKESLDKTKQIDLLLYGWENVTDEDQDTPISYWNSCYNAISQANHALLHIEKLRNNKNKSKMEAYEGEALLARAYAHFMLVTFWGKRYDPETSELDLGIPYVIEPEETLVKEYSRNTVEDVYKRVEKDMIKGLNLVRGDYEKPKYHFTKDAGNVFASRFYLYKGDWDKVISHASIVLGSSPANQIRDVNGEYASLGYTRKEILYSSASEKSNVLITSVSSLTARWFDGYRFGLTAKIMKDLFGTKSPINRGWAYGIHGNDLVFNIPKYKEYFKYSNRSARIGHPYANVVLFNKDEALLNRAEAYAMKKQYKKSIEDLTAFLSKKTIGYNSKTDTLKIKSIIDTYPKVPDEYTPFYALEDTVVSFIKAIAEFKRREFYHEGMRWFDVKRFRLKVTHKFANGDLKVLSKDDLRKQLPIPESAVKFGTVANPKPQGNENK